MANLYLPSGYLNFATIDSFHTPYNFIVGGRGTGKTFGALDYTLEQQRKFMIMRRTQTQLDIISKQEYSPLNPVAQKRGENIVVKSLTKSNNAYYYANDENQPSGAPIGYSTALSTIANLRGFDASGVENLIFDEFIPEPHERKIKNEGAAFLNAYETINRNRELQDRPPLKAYLLANALEMGNPIFLELGLVQKAEKMIRSGQELSIDTKRGYTLIILTKSPISQAKSESALYNLTKDSEFAEMAIGNRFAEIDSRVKSNPLAEYRAIVTVGEITIYKHKSRAEWYVSAHRQGTPDTYQAARVDLQRFKRAYGNLWGAYMTNKIVFESTTCEILFQKYYENS